MKLLAFTVILCLMATTYGLSIRKTSQGLIRKARDVSDSAEDIEFEKALEEIIIVVKAKCDETAGNELAFQNLMEGVATAVNCFNTTIESLPDSDSASEEDSSEEVSLDDVKSLFQVVCPLQQQLFKCLTEFSKVVDGCLTVDEKETKDNLLGVVSGVSDYVCENEGSRVITFIEQEGVECVNNTLVEGDMVCAEKAKAIVDDDFSFLQTEASCNSFGEERLCILGNIQKCNKPKITEIIDGLFNVVWGATSCKKFSPLPELTSNAL